MRLLLQTSVFMSVTVIAALKGKSNHQAFVAISMYVLPVFVVELLCYSSCRVWKLRRLGELCFLLLLMLAL